MIGKTISHYKILEKLGEGGMGVVYKAEDTKLDRFVALKFLPPHLSQSGEEKKRFIHEAKTASALDHPHICTIHEIDETEDGQMFIVMAYYAGESLKDKIERGPLPIAEAINITIQIVAGLTKAHAKDIIHRDIKPANILITEDNQVKIVDFGLAKLAGRTQLTKEGSSMGTVAYMSPEQTQGAEVDHRTDIWALGAILYEMISGQQPFVGDYEQAVMYSIMNEDPEPLTGLRSGVPMGLEQLVNKCLDKNPGERYQHVDEMPADFRSLKRVLESGKKGEDSISLRPSRKKRMTILGGIVGLFLIAVVTSYFFFPPEPSSGDRKSIAVLPFENISADPEAEPFVKGMHEGLLTELSRIAKLKVISRTSVMQYADTKKGIPAIANELGVFTVLEGTVQRVEDRVRVTVQLIDGQKDVHIWAENYDRKLTARNIFAIQTELAKKIADRLEAHLTPEEERAVERTPTEDLEAYRLYVQARTQLDQRTEEGMRRAVNYFELAIARDSSYALPWVGLADASALLYIYGHEDATNVLPRAEAAARHALELNPRLGEAHASLGLLHEARREGPAQIQELERAVELRPGYAEAHSWLSWVHMLLGYPMEALESAKRAVELNPLSPEPVSNLSLSYLTNGEWQKALREARRVRVLQSDWSTGPFYEGLALYHLGRYTEAKSALQDLLVRWAGAGPLVTLALAHVATGDTATARELLARLEEMDEPLNVGLVHAAFGEKEEALKAFGKVDRWNYWPTLSVRYFFPHVLGPLREDLRFDQLLGEVNRSWGLNPDGGLPAAAAPVP